MVMTHDYTRNLHVDTRIGERCQIGAHSLVMPGVTIGDECVVAPASVVMKDVPSNTLVAGNPARMIERGIKTEALGQADPRSRSWADAATPTAEPKPPDRPPPPPTFVHPTQSRETMTLETAVTEASP